MLDVIALGLTHASFFETQSGADTLLTHGTDSIRIFNTLAITLSIAN